MLTFATLSTNIKIMIGLLIISIIGIIYTVIKNIYKSSKKNIIEGGTIPSVSSRQIVEDSRQFNFKTIVDKLWNH